MGFVNERMQEHFMCRCMRIMFLFLCMMLLAVPASANTIDRIVAVVNGDLILLSELQSRVELVAHESPDLDLSDPSSRRQVKRAVLDQMIQEQLAEQEARRLNIAVSESEVNEAIASIKRENGFTDDQLEYLIQQQGLTMDQFRQDIRRQLERSRLVDRVFKSKTVITQEQVDAYLKSNPGAAGSSQETYRLAVIFLPFTSGSPETLAEDRVAAERIHERLKRGEDFASMAAQYSKGPAADEGGDIGYMASHELASDISAAVQGLGANDVSPVVEGAGGHYILKVLDVRREEMSSSQMEAREKVKRELFQQEVTRKFENWVRDLESRAFVDVRL